MERVQLFYERTFWCNLDVFKCFQAAIAIAKRGFNVDRCFTGISPGGVGQSLYSHHLSEMYKHNHSYFDPNIWHLDEELRKQVESFAKCFILTGQEAPETSRKLHIDLYKKMMSGDGIMARKPYGYSTRMFQTIGWTRLEVNKMMAFLGVTNANFNSMLRRAFVWKAKARFVHEKFLRNYKDHEKDGVFAADPSLCKFLSSSQASIAGLKLQCAFEVDRNKDDCYQLIEDYCNGGDGHLTEDVMREACGLPMRVHQLQEQDDVGNLLAAGQESADEREEKDSEWVNLRNHLAMHMLDKDMELMTWYEFKKVACKPGEHPNLSKAEMWEQLKEKGVVRTALVRQKSSKEKPGAYIPMMTFSKQHCDICPQRSLDTIHMQFDEEVDIGLARKYAYGCRGRSMNIDTMKAFYKSMLPVAKKGRRTAEQEDVMQTYHNHLRKLEDHEKALTKLLTTRQGRRLRAKRSVEGDDPVSPQHGLPDGREYVSLKHSRTTSYGYSEKQPYTVRARRYATTDGVQSMSRRLQLHVVDGHTIDLDIQNCCLTLLQQILAQTAPQPAMPDDLAQLLDRLAKDRTGVLQQLGLNIVEGKEVINTVLNGGSPPTSLKGNAVVKGIQKISLYVRWVACNLLHADYMSLAEQKQKTFPSSAILSLLWTSVEDRILQNWTDHILSHTNQPKHLSLHFDGGRISADHVGALQDDFIRECENAIYKRTGFLVKIVSKKHFTFMDLVKNRSTHGNALTNVPDIMFQPGNCIPCALWHVVPLSRTAIVAAVSNTSLPKNVEAKSVGYRDYRSVAAMCSVDLSSCLGMPSAHVKAFMIHYEGHGLPHSIAVRVSASGKDVTIIDGATVYKLDMATLHEIHCAAVDHSTIVSYWKKDPQDKKDDKSATLLDMVAGARDVAEDLDEDSSQDVSEVRAVEMPNTLSFDEDNVPVFNDNILESLKNETSDILNDLQKKSMRSEGRRHCPPCPFRSFTQLRLLRTHIAKHHTKKNQYVCSGTKQIKVTLAIYDHAASSQRVAVNLLQESAMIIRQTVQPPLHNSHNSIDKQIRLVFDAAGPKYVNVSSIGSDLQVRTVSTRCHMAALESGIVLSSLFPRRSPHWMPMLEDIVTAPIFLKKMEDMNKVLLEQDEWHYISMDATLKLCMKLMGQASYRSPKSVRNEAPFGNDVAWRRLLTVRGRTGAVLLLHPLQSESADQVVDAMAQNFSTEQLGAKLFNELKTICPSMRSLVLDPIHLAIVYEYGFWNKRSPGSKQLRRILQKCISIDADLGHDAWGTFYDGTNARPLTEEEMKYREMISGSFMDSRECNGMLDNLDTNVPFGTRLEFIQCRAALCRRYPAEVNRKIAGANKQISKILWSACAPDRLEWLMNNLRVRHALPSSYQWFLPSGTSSNEALHAEINSWSRSTNVIHRSTLGMKLKYFSYIKLLLHYLSVRYPLSHTVSASMLLSRSLHRSLWSEDDWNVWCAEQSSLTVPKKATLPLSTARQLEARLVRQHVSKRPASKKQGNASKKRRVTPLSVKRIHTLRSAGVKAGTKTMTYAAEWIDGVEPEQQIPRVLFMCWQDTSHLAASDVAS
ncbi:unnamed protein product [Symbiodinium sp. CCMP2592]|nr:unnamed protein product [Symbiodinium sp. CCMP2592]